MPAKWREEGHCKISLRDGSCLHLRRADYSKITAHWKKGETFGEFDGVYTGFKITVKFAEVNAVMDCPAEAIEEERVDNIAEEI